MNKKELQIIGRTSTIAFPEDGIFNLSAKIDTGADSSSVWASDISIDDKNRLHFTLLADGESHYTGREKVVSNYGVKLVRSSNGQSQIRFSVRLLVKIGGKSVRSLFTLADRSRNTYPVLIGCRLLRNKFFVDVARGAYKESEGLTSEGAMLQAELKQDPRAFYQKYHSSHKPESEVI